MLRLNGNCGGPAPKRLRLLISPGTDRCPVAQGLEDPDVLVAAQVLPGPVSEGVLGEDVMALPHRWRMLSAMARQWRAQHGGTNGPE